MYSLSLSLVIILSSVFHVKVLLPLVPAVLYHLGSQFSLSSHSGHNDIICCFCSQVYTVYKAGHSLNSIRKPFYFFIDNSDSFFDQSDALAVEYVFYLIQDIPRA